MAKAELKTRKTAKSVDAFLKSIPDEQVREDCRTIEAMMRKAMRVEPKMWGAAMIGYGDVHYKYASGREGDWFRMGFSPRKQNLTLYLLCGAPGEATLLKSLGKHSTGKSCLYIRRLSDVHLPTLRKLIEACAKRGGWCVTQ